MYSCYLIGIQIFSSLQIKFPNELLGNQIRTTASIDYQSLHQQATRLQKWQYIVNSPIHLALNLQQQQHENIVVFNHVYKCCSTLLEQMPSAKICYSDTKIIVEHGTRNVQMPLAKMFASQPNRWARVFIVKV